MIMNIHYFTPTEKTLMLPERILVNTANEYSLVLQDCLNWPTSSKQFINIHVLHFSFIFTGQDTVFAFAVFGLYSSVTGYKSKVLQSFYHCLQIC